MRRNMRFSAVAGVAVIALCAVVLLSTCDMDFFGDGDKKIAYTDVWYSEDGSMVTLYLDGVGIPVSEAGAGRALNRDMAKFSYNYLEAVFIYGDIVFDDDTLDVTGTGAVARSRWSIGQTAGIRGVPRGDPGVGVNYGEVFSDSSGPAATIFVGRDDGTLLGVGSIGWVDDPRGSNPVGINTTVYSTTTSVTFLVSAFYTGLALDPSPTNGTVDLAGGTFLTAAGDTGVYAAVSQANTIVNISAIDGTDYPLYYLPNNQKTILASYTIEADAIDKDDPASTPLRQRQPLNSSVSALMGSPSNSAGSNPSTRLTEAIRLADISSISEQVILRIPSYQSAGRVRELIQSYYYKIGATLTANNSANGAEFNPVLTFTFDTTGQPKAEGVFGFGFDIPVYAITPSNSTNGGDGAYDWAIRSSFGQARYLLDDGEGAGGLVLMGVDVTATDWLEMYFKWR